MTNVIGPTNKPTVASKGIPISAIGFDIVPESLMTRIATSPAIQNEATAIRNLLAIHLPCNLPSMPYQCPASFYAFILSHKIPLSQSDSIAGGSRKAGARPDGTVGKDGERPDFRRWHFAVVRMERVKGEMNSGENRCHTSELFRLAKREWNHTPHDRPARTVRTLRPVTES